MKSAENDKETKVNEAKVPADPVKMATAALLYGLTSVCLVVSNKICLTTFEFPDAVFLAL